MPLALEGVVEGEVTGSHDSDSEVKDNAPDGAESEGKRGEQHQQHNRPDIVARLHGHPRELISAVPKLDKPQAEAHEMGNRATVAALERGPHGDG